MKRLLILGVFMLLWATPSRAAAAFVQACKGSTFSGTTASCTLTPTAGNVFAVWVTGLANGSNPFAFADTCNSGGTSDTYTGIDNPALLGGGGAATAAAVAVVGASSSCTITVTIPGASGGANIIVHEVRGVDTSAPVDVHAVHVGGFGDSATVSTTTTVNGDYLFAGTDNTGNVTFTAGSGYTIPTNGSQLSFATEYQVQSTAGATTATFVGSGNWIDTEIVALKPAGGGGGAVPPPTQMMMGCCEVVGPVRAPCQSEKSGPVRAPCQSEKSGPVRAPCQSEKVAAASGPCQSEKVAAASGPCQSEKVAAASGPCQAGKFAHAADIDHRRKRA
jgi:hypothetical protein